MKVSSFTQRQLGRWLPFATIILLFICGVFVRNTVPSVVTDSAEVAQTATYLTSPNSLKVLINTLDRQVRAAEQSWSSAMNWMVFGVLLLAGIALYYWFRCYQMQQRLELLEKERQEQER